MNNIIINHPDGDISLDELKRKAFNIIDDYDLKQIIQGLINKIIELDKTNKNLRETNSMYLKKIIELDAELTSNKSIINALDNHISIKPQINISKGQYVVALENCTTSKFPKTNITKDKCYECVQNHIIIDDDGDMQSISTFKNHFKQAR